MKKNILLTTALITFFATNAYSSDYSTYVSAKIKAVETQTSVKAYGEKYNFTDTTLGGSVAVGVAYENIRGELEYNFQDSANEKSMFYKSSASSFLLNSYYDFHNDSKITPYISVGVGISDITSKIMADNGNQTNKSTDLAYQIGAGISYDVSSNLKLDTGYRFVDNGNISFERNGGIFKTDLQANEFYVGARYSF